MISAQTLALAHRVAVSLARDDIESFQTLTQANGEPLLLQAFLEWLKIGPSPSEIGKLDQDIRALTPPNARYFYGGRLGVASNMDERVMAFLEAAPTDRQLSRRFEALERGGWKPKVKTIAAMYRLCAEAGDSAGLLWLAERGRLPLQKSQGELDHRYERSAICLAFREQSDQDLATLERLTALGVFADGEGLVGFTDFMSFGQLKSARKLGELGFKPRDLILPGGRARPGSSAVVTYMRLVVIEHAESERRAQKMIADIRSDLGDLAARGASFAPKSSDPKDAALSDPFYASVHGRYARVEKTPLMLAAYDRIKELGADPNASGLYLAEETRMMDWQGGDSVYFDHALRLGADPSLRPGLLLAAPAGWSGCMRISAVSWMEKLIKLGADPAKIPAQSLPVEHPIAWALVNKNFFYASNCLRLGVSPAWTSSEDGSTCFHLLASLTGAEAQKLCERLAANPLAKTLIDHPTRQADGKGGETALMLACAALDLGKAKALLDAGANPNAQDARGWTPLHHAGRRYGAKAQTKCAPVISLLLERGANPARANNAGLTAGQAMAKRAPLAGLAELLSARPEDIIGPGEAAKKAAEALSKRGALATSIVEQAILEGESAPPAPAKKARSRL